MSHQPYSAAAWIAAMGESRVTPFPERVVYVSNPWLEMAWPAEQTYKRFAQCGHTESKMDWLFEQLREPKVVNLNASRLSLAVSLAIRSM